MRAADLLNLSQSYWINFFVLTGEGGHALMDSGSGVVVVALVAHGW